MAHTILFNDLISRNELTTEFKGTGRFWYFDNGQYGEKTEHTIASRYYLSYYNDRIYVSSCFVHDSFYGSCTMSCQKPLSIINNQSIIYLVKELFEADKKSKIINENYSFK